MRRWLPRVVAFPWYYVGGGVKLPIGERRYRLSFLEPAGSGSALPALLGWSGSLIE